uniref:Uncharacterized protein n=1 Tax=Rhizophora mucronata TaxID=61149 RepID=A0A2P2PE75_RHIMU
MIKFQFFLFVSLRGVFFSGDEPYCVYFICFENFIFYFFKLG